MTSKKNFWYCSTWSRTVALGINNSFWCSSTLKTRDEIIILWYYYRNNLALVVSLHWSFSQFVVVECVFSFLVVLED